MFFCFLTLHLNLSQMEFLFSSISEWNLKNYFRQVKQTYVERLCTFFYSFEPTSHQPTMPPQKRKSASRAPTEAGNLGAVKQVPAYSAAKFKLPDEHLHRVWYSRNRPLEYLIHWNACRACQEEVLDPLGSTDSDVRLTT